LKRVFVVALLGVGVAYGRWYWYQAQNPAPSLQFECQKLSRGDLAQAITASGELNPVTKVEISSQISGNIQKLYVDFNSPVKQGQVLAELDPASYEANVLTAEGNLANAEADLELAQINEQRARNLRKNSLNSPAEYDQALADLHKAQAALKISRASLRKAQVELARCTIRSPVDGIVIYRNINVGQTVAASLSAPVLMVIANDLTKMQIDANVVEADIGAVRTNQPVEFRVDAYPNEKFKGNVVQVRNAPREQLNVVVYQTIIEVSNADLKLKPGMTATVAIIVASRENALKIPNAALRFKPPRQAAVVEIQPMLGIAGPRPESPKAPPADPAKAEKKTRQKSDRTVYLLADEEASPSAEQGAMLGGWMEGPWQWWTAVMGAKAEKVPALRAVEIKTGVTDGTSTEVLEGLPQDARVVTAVAKTKERESRGFNPFAYNRR